MEPPSAKVDLVVTIFNNFGNFDNLIILITFQWNLKHPSAEVDFSGEDVVLLPLVSLHFRYSLDSQNISYIPLIHRKSQISLRFTENFRCPIDSQVISDIPSIHRKPQISLRFTENLRYSFDSQKISDVPSIHRKSQMSHRFTDNIRSLWFTDNVRYSFD